MIFFFERLDVVSLDVVSLLRPLRERRVSAIPALDPIVWKMLRTEDPWDSPRPASLTSAHTDTDLSRQGLLAKIMAFPACVRRRRDRRHSSRSWLNRRRCAHPFFLDRDAPRTPARLCTPARLPRASLRTGRGSGTGDYWSGRSYYKLVHTMTGA